MGVAATAGGTLLSACGELKGSASIGSSGSASDVLKIGYVRPQTGPLASFAAADNVIVKTVQDSLAKGFTAGGKKRTIEIVVKDSQSSATRATDVTKELINNDQVDL
ncbi:MAG TPA: ABC transporter substrate-binding protein, partial [Actinomycetes bacterium]